MWLGSNKGNKRKALGFKWNSDTIKNLGYTYGRNTTQTREKKLGKGKKKNPRGFTEMGKFTTITYRKENFNKSRHAK